MTGSGECREKKFNKSPHKLEKFDDIYLLFGVLFKLKGLNMMSVKHKSRGQ